MATSPRRNGLVDHNTDIDAIYTRYSPRPKKLKKSKGQLPREFDARDVDEVKSIENQIATCQKYIDFKPELFTRPVSIFRDPHTSGTAALEDRPEGEELVTQVKAGRVKNIVVQRLDRIFRNTVDGLNTLELFDRRGVALHLAAAGGVTADSSTAMGKLVVTQMLAFTEFERNIIVERTSEAMQRYVASGLKMSSNPPFGQQIHPDDDKILIPHPAEQEAIRAAVGWYERGISYRGIARKLAEDGHKPRGKKWDYQLIKKMIDRYYADPTKEPASNAIPE